MPSSTKLVAAAVGASALAAAPTAVMAASYVVRPGDTLWDIAVRHGTTVAALARANGISETGIVRVGQHLTIPDDSLGLAAYTRHASDVDMHEVRHGETLWSIARAYGVDLTALARANGMGASDTLYPGAVLQVPGRLPRMNALLTATATEVGVDARLVRAVAWMESGWRQDAVSPTGALGVMQIEPSTGAWVARNLAKRSLDLHVTRDNILAGCLLLHHLLGIHHGGVDAALAGYYQGDGSVAQHGVYDDTRQYQRVVGALMSQDA